MSTVSHDPHAGNGNACFGFIEWSETQYEPTLDEQLCSAIDAGNIIAAVQHLNAAGFPTFPCMPNAKRPSVAGGFKVGSTEMPPDHRANYEAGHNVALVTGNGLLALDYDIGGTNREARRKFLAAYRKHCGSGKRFNRQITRRGNAAMDGGKFVWGKDGGPEDGGWQIIGRVPAGLRLRPNVQGVLGKESKIDIRGGGDPKALSGYVITGPSFVDGKSEGAGKNDGIAGFYEPVGTWWPRDQLDEFPEAFLRELELIEEPQTETSRAAKSSRKTSPTAGLGGVGSVGPEDPQYVWSMLGVCGDLASGGEDQWKDGIQLLWNLSYNDQVPEDTAFNFADKWSALGGDKYKGRTDVEAKWASRKPAAAGVIPLGIGTLRKWATERGWSEEAWRASQGVSMPAVTAITSPAGGTQKPALVQRHIEFPVLSEKGAPRPCCENLEVLVAALGLRFARDTWQQQNMVLGLNAHDANFASAAEIDDDVLNWLRPAGERYGLIIGKDLLADYTSELARRHSFDPLREYLSRIVWDGTPRVDRLLIDYFQAPDTALARASARLFVRTAVRRARDAGAKADTLLILEGPQGGQKSGGIEVLAGGEPYYADGVKLGINAKEMIEQTAGAWIVEIPELDGLSKADANAVKKQLSSKSDRARGTWARLAKTHKRKFTSVATTNMGFYDLVTSGGSVKKIRKPYLHDDTGNRRFVPQAVGQVDIEALARDRDQIWAEAVAIEAATRHEPLALPRDLWSVAASEAEKRRIQREPEKMLRDLLDGVTGIVATEDLWQAVNPGSTVGQRKDADGSLMVSVLSSLGWSEKRMRDPSIKSGDTRRRVWLNDVNGPWLVPSAGTLVPRK